MASLPKKWNIVLDTTEAIKALNELEKKVDKIKKKMESIGVSFGVEVERNDND